MGRWDKLWYLQKNCLLRDVGDCHRTDRQHWRRMLMKQVLSFLLLLSLLPLPCQSQTPAVNTSTYAVTAGSGTGITVNKAAESTRTVYKITTTYQAFSTAALTADATIATLPAKTRLCGLHADVTQAFSGGSVATASLSLGTSAGGVG